MNMEFPSTYLILDFIHLTFVVFLIQILNMFCQIYTQYLIWGNANINGVGFLILNYICSLLVYKKAVDLRINLLCCANQFQESLRFSVQMIVSSVNKKSFTFSFPMCIPFISFSCLTVLTRTSIMMLKRISDRRFPCHLPDLSGKAQSLSPVSLMIATGFQQMFLIKLSKFPFIPIY